MKFDMKLNTFSDPFFRMVAHTFYGAVCGLIGGVVIGAIIGLIAQYSSGYGDAGSLISVGSMAVGSVLGAILGGIVGIVRKD